ncbi:hypothetical protein BJ170DRAFT_681115 [Xylariales sp. AK1849]|nr:hypothetical protein BJ170DRAFT_681115 [Xylariales sp. AK1849]
MPLDNSQNQGATGAAKFVTSSVGNVVGGISRTVGNVTGAAGRGVGDTITGATGSAGKPVGDALGSLGTGVENGASGVAKGVENAGHCVEAALLVATISRRPKWRSDFLLVKTARGSQTVRGPPLKKPTVYGTDNPATKENCYQHHGPAQGNNTYYTSRIPVVGGPVIGEWEVRDDVLLTK